MDYAAADNPKGVSANLLVVALWFGLVAGLLEGVGSLALQQLGRLDGVWVEIVWVSPLFAALLFGALGLLMLLPYLIYRRLPVLTVAVFTFSALALFILLELALPPEIHAGALMLLSAGAASVFTRWFRRHPTQFIRFSRRSLPVVAVATLLVVAAVHGGFWLREAIS